MSDASAQDRLPPGLRFLKLLVIVLTLSMIGGVITVVWVIVTRMPQALRAAPAQTVTLTLPETLALPPGTEATAFTQGVSWYAVITADDRILIFDRATGALRQTIALTP